MGLPIVGGLSCGLVMAQVSRSEPWLPYASPHERAHQRAGHADTIPPIRISRELHRAEQRLPSRRRRSWCFLCDYGDGSRHPCASRSCARAATMGASQGQSSRKVDPRSTSLLASLPWLSRIQRKYLDVSTLLSEQGNSQSIHRGQATKATSQTPTFTTLSGWHIVRT